MRVARRVGQINLPYSILCSAINEDTAESSQAGKYESIGGVSGVRGRGKRGHNVVWRRQWGGSGPGAAHAENVKMCGVAFTVDTNSLGNYIEQYFYGFNPFQYEKIGTIVMNCNPFTYEHRYLIEQALETIKNSPLTFLL